MASSNLELLIKLRKLTNMSIGLCKKALQEANYDLKEAKEILKKKGAAFSKKENNVLNHKRVGVLEDSKFVCMVAIGSETDFVIKNKSCLDLLNNALQTYLKTDKPLEEVMAEEVKTCSANMGENIKILFADKVKKDSDFVNFYIDEKEQDYDNIGKTGVIIKSNCEDKDLMTQVAMHIAYYKPKIVSEDDLTEAEKADFNNFSEANSSILEKQTFIFQSNINMKNLFSKNNIIIKSFLVF